MRLLSICAFFLLASCGANISLPGTTVPSVELPQPPEPPKTPDTFVGKHGFLKVSGPRIVDERGEEIQLRGMSLFWSQWSSPFYNEKAVESVKQGFGATVIRAAMGVEMGGYLQDRDTQKALVKRVVDAAVKNDIYVIIDWHDHNAHLHEREAIAFFSEMAETYKNTPNVIFELYNEPIGTPWGQIKRYAENVTAAIREKGANHLVVVGTPMWSQDVDQAAKDPLSDENVAYTLHFYATTHKGSLRNKAQYALDQGIALFVTEFGTTEATGDGYVDLGESERWMAFMDDNKISWANWSLFDKAESASALKPGSSPTGPWGDDRLTTSGAYIKKKILEGSPR